MTTLRARLSLVSLDTLRHGLVLFAATSAVSVLNYLFHVVLSRMLGPAEYATLAAVLALFAGLSAPVGAAQALMADYVARFAARQELGKASGFSRAALKWLGLASLLLAAAVILLAQPLSRFLQIHSLAPLVALALVCLTALLNPPLTGTLQGLQRFWGLALVLLLVALVRLVAGVALAALDWGATGGLLASAIAGAIGIAAGLLGLRDLLVVQGEAHGLTAAEIGRYAGQALASGVLFSAFLSLDVVLVKHYFAPETAGQYAAAATVGKMVFFLPAAVGTLMFPRVSTQFAAGGDGVGALRKGALVILLLCGAMVAGLSLFPAVVTQTLFGPAFAPTARLVGPYGFAMLLFALANLLMLYHLARHESRFALLLGAGMLVELAGVLLFHERLEQVLVVLSVSAGAVILVGEVWLRGFTGRART
jgi:O-antigen/teichoic acid export membrane protein